MPSRAAEIYTYPAESNIPAAIEARRLCACRFRGAGEECNQVEHRHEKAFVQLQPHPDLLATYARERIPMGLCSLWNLARAGDEPWIVCPHRMFYAGPTTTTID